jgi:hypothetical protein
MSIDLKYGIHSALFLLCLTVAAFSFTQQKQFELAVPAVWEQ